jgi:LysR family transcriptional regulator, transcriptional activator of the cysJI operon
VKKSLSSSYRVRQTGELSQCGQGPGKRPDIAVIESFRVAVFRVVAERLSFTQAAEMLHLSQPAVTSHVKAIEEELGVRLFDRAAGGVHLTLAGEQLLRYANDVSRLAELTLRKIGRLNGEERGRLRLGASTTIAQYLLPGLLAEFVQLYPRAELSVVSGNTAQIVAKIVAREIDLGLIEGPPGATDLKLESFVEDEIVAIASTRHRFVKDATKVTLAALAEQPLVMREPGSGTRRVVENALRKVGLSTRNLRILMELDSTEAIKSGVEAGLGVGFVSRWALRDEQMRSIRIVKVDGLHIERSFQFIHPHGPGPQGINGAFLHLARDFRPRFKAPL